MKTYSHIGMSLSLILHLLAGGGIWAAFTSSSPKPQEFQPITSISLEMLAARLEQEQVAVSSEADTEQEPEIQSQKIVEPEPEVAVPQPVEKPKVPEKPKIKPKPKPQPEKQKVEPVKKKSVQTLKNEKVVKALEKGEESKQGIVAKAIPNANVGTKTQAGVAQSTGQATGAANAGNSNEINAYKAQLQRALQQRANNMYPQRERMMRKSGIVTVSFHFSAKGEISQVQLVHSSGNTNLDNAALKATQSTRMSSPPPAGFPRTFSVPIQFSISSN